MICRLAAICVAAIAGLAAVASAPAVADRSVLDVSKLDKEGVAVSLRRAARGKNKLSGGYPLGGENEFALRFYWLAMQDRFADEFDEVDLYTPRGFFLGSFPERFVRALRMEGSGLLSDGRVVNYAGRCKFGTGTCFEQLDDSTHPYGRGAGLRPLIPFKSVAVDRRLIAIGDPLYIPEFDGLLMPDGHIHDGCVRADDTGGNIKKKKMDFFVVSYENFRFLLGELPGGTWITPHIEHPRCMYLRQ